MRQLLNKTEDSKMSNLVQEEGSHAGVPLKHGLCERPPVWQQLLACS